MHVCVYAFVVRQTSVLRLVKVWALTWRDEEDACAEDDVMAAPVELTGGYTQAPHEQEAHTHDGEDTRGSDGT